MMQFIVEEMTSDELKDYVRQFNSVRNAFEDMRFAKDNLIEALARVAGSIFTPSTHRYTSLNAMNWYPSTIGASL